LDDFNPLGEAFEKYVESLAASGRHADVDAVIEVFSPHWDHNLGYGKLGTAAFRCERFELAERYFIQLKSSMPAWHRSETMGFLAQIWHRNGRTEDAHELLVECLKRLLDESQSATGSDKKLFEDWFQNHRSTYLQLFPERGDAALAEHRIPRTTRR
jgi:hypothetical protein